MQDSKQVIVRSTKGQIKEVKESLFWKDVKRELAMWKHGFEKECLTVVDECINHEENSASTLTHLGSIHGRCMAVDYLLQLPNIFLQVLEDEEDESRRNKAD